MLRTDVSGSPYVGVFGRATDTYALLHPRLDDDEADALAAELGVDAVRTTVGGAATVGALTAGTADGLLLSGRVTDRERERIEGAVPVPVGTLPGRVNAAGNVVLATEIGAYVHPDLADEAVETVGETLGVPVERGEIAGVRTVGTAAVATESGALCHPEATEAELETVEATLGVRADVGTVNYGSPAVGAGLIANGTGYVAGSDTSGPELGRIEEALGFVDD